MNKDDICLFRFFLIYSNSNPLLLNSADPSVHLCPAVLWHMVFGLVNDLLYILWSIFYDLYSMVYFVCSPAKSIICCVACSSPPILLWAKFPSSGLPTLRQGGIKLVQSNKHTTAQSLKEHCIIDSCPLNGTLQYKELSLYEQFNLDSCLLNGTLQYKILSLYEQFNLGRSLLNETLKH